MNLCNHKEIYLTYTEAKRIAKKCRLWTDEAIGFYRCKSCQKWHVGNTRYQKRKKPKLLVHTP